MITEKQKIIHFYFMVEMAFALGLLMVLTTCFFATLNTIRQMDKSFTDENCGLMIVDNTIERLEYKKRYNIDDVKRIFLEEYEKGGIKDKTRMSYGFKAGDDGAGLAIIKPNGKPLIEVQIKCHR